MTKTRLETFSDGVFAIVITLLVLDIKVPEVDYNHLGSALIALTPKFISYLLSFSLIGLYWLGHHFYFEKIKKVDGSFLWLNILFLLLVSVLPFPTALLGKYPLMPIPLTLYGLNMLLVNTVSFIMLRYIYCNKQLANEYFKDEFYQLQLPIFIYMNSFYIIAILFSYWLPIVSYIIYILLLVVGIKIYIKRINKENKIL